jgi:hypothetical protein
MKIENGKKNRKGKAKSYNNKDKIKDFPKSENLYEDRGNYINKGNHPSWYKTNEQLAKDTASIPFGYQLGGRKDHGPYGGKFNDYAVAGIMRLNYMPTYGHLENITAPLNIASRNIYTFLKSVNSRAKTYDAPDIALYMCAVDSLLSFHEFMKRIYGLMNTASVTNRYYAEAAVRAAGGDYNDILGNINDFRAYINTFALRMSTLAIPAEFSIFARHAWLNAHVWYDSENPTKAQSYVFCPSGFWKYKLDDDGAGMLSYSRISAYGEESKTELTFNQIKTIGEELISAVLYGAGDEDFNIMGGDILYAYGESKIYRATTITEDYAVVPKYDSWVCDQINNCRAYGIPTDKSQLIKQDADKRYLTHTVKIQLNNTFHGDVMEYPWNSFVMDQYVNLFDGDTSSDHVMVATRLLNIPNPSTEGDHRVLEFLAIATELVENFTCYYYASLTGRAADWRLYRSGVNTSSLLIAEVTVDALDNAYEQYPVDALNAIAAMNSGVSNVIAQYSVFDRKPIMYINKLTVDTNRDEDDTYHGRIVRGNTTGDAVIDLNNYSIISYATLKQMNDTILLAMFGIDEFGKQISLK